MDALDPKTFDALPKGSDVVIDNVSAFKAGGFPRVDHQKIVHQAHRNLAEWAQRIGARAILIGVLGSDEVDESVPHFLEKRDAEKAYRDAAVPLISVRPGMFIDQEDGRLEKGFQKGVYQHLGPTDVKLAFTETKKVVAAVVQAVNDKPSSVKFRVVSVGQNWTAAEFAAVMSTRLGKPVKVSALPLPLFSAITFLPRLFSPGLRNLLGMMQFIASGRFAVTDGPSASA